jgi:hypothetical protein
MVYFVYWIAKKKKTQKAGLAKKKKIFVLILDINMIYASFKTAFLCILIKG